MRGFQMHDAPGRATSAREELVAQCLRFGCGA
jgi:hypothetical protein